MSRPVVLFFARGYQAEFFPVLRSDRYEAVFVTLTRAERLRVERAGGRVVGCFEEDYDTLPAQSVTEQYLITSFMSDRFLGRYSYPKRLEILGKEVAFWARLFEQYSPAAVVNELVAIEISEVLLIEARRRGIRYLAGMNCLVDDFFYWLRDPLSLSGRHLLEAVPGDEATAHARAYMEEVMARDYKPFYVKNLRGRLNLPAFAVAVLKLAMWKWRRGRSAARGRFRYEVYDDEYAKKVVVFFRSLYRRYDSLADLPTGCEVVFYPLHQEPEATLNYMSEFYSNQVATIENILKCLRANQVLVVKEHPVDKGSLLRTKFWEIRRQYSSLYYLPAELHAREVLAVTRRVVTLTSTVGWEAAVTGKTVYVLGQIFYDNLAGIAAIRNFDELKRALRAEPPPSTLDRTAVEQFVARMTAQSYRGNPFPHAELYSERNRQCVVHAIADALGL